MTLPSSAPFTLSVYIYGMSYGSFTKKTTSNQKILFGKGKLREQKF